MMRLMTLTTLAAAMQAALAAEPSPAVAPPVPGQDYYSWQIVSGSPKNLEKLYRQYSTLPYVRIERRGELHVLRAGFWSSSRAAREALATHVEKNAFVRVAAYRPEAIVRRNWEESTAMTVATVAPTPPAEKIAAPPAPSLSIAPVRPVPAPVPPRPSERSPEAAQRPQPSPTPAPEVGDSKSFNAADYALAFDAFMGAGDMERALLVAKKAVASVPSDVDWRRKLARLGDWTQRPQLAWENWTYLFHHGDHSNEVVNAVLRLAPLTEQPELAIRAWEIRAARVEPTPAQWADLYNLYDMAGKEKEGSLYFERQYRRLLAPAFLEQAAKMAANGGDEERALRLFTERAQLKPFSMDATLQAVVILIRGDRMREAYVLMQSVSPEVTGEATEFWRILGNVAWELQEVDGAEKAYQQFANSPQATAGGWSRLIYLVRQRHPKQSADLALEAYRRFGQLDNLLLALEIYAQVGDMPGQTGIFKRLSAQDIVQFESNVRFLLLRAQYHQHRAEMDLAWLDYRRALAKNPDDAQAAVPALWFLIDSGRKAELEPMLLALTPRAQKDSAYWLPFSAGYHALDRFQTALEWYRKEIRRSPQDALFFLNFADALARVNQTGMADRVRRHAWQMLQEKFPKPDLQAPLDSQPELLALARLALLNQPGDPGLALVRQVVSQLRGLPNEPTQTRQTRDLILGWAISKEQFPNARSWMWLNYARQAGKDNAPPAWGESQTALQLNDTKTMDRLIAQEAQRLPVYNRYDTAYALEHWPQALDIAFQGMQNNPVDEPLYDRYRQHAPLHTNYVQLKFTNEMLGVLDVSSRQLEARLVIEPKWHLMLGWSQNLQSSSDPATGSFVPGVEQINSVGLRWLGARGEARASVFQRNELDRNLGLKLSQNYSVSQRLVLEGSLGLHVDSTDSLPLRVGGYEDQLRLGFGYVISKREYLRYGTRLARFYTQYGDYLGSGQSHDLEAGYRIRTEYPDFRVRVFASQQSYTYDGQVGAQTLSHLSPETINAINTGNLDPVKYFLPQGSSTWGACLGMGENLAGQSVQEVYTRAFRPFFDACLSNNSLNGAGYSGMIGLAGTVTGEDHLSLRMEQSSGGSGSGALTKILALRYRHYF